jgi:Leucine-rich repeat (LRR) protein
MALSKAEIENLSNLFLSVNDENTRLAFEIMDQQDLPKNLITEIFAVYKLTEDEGLRAKAEGLLKQHASSQVQSAMNWRLKLNDDGSLYGATEKTIAKNIDRYCDGKELIGSKLATAMFRKFGVGAHYLLNNVGEEERKNNLKTFIEGTSFKLRNVALTKFPPELFEFTELTEIDLAGNKIKTIPAKIKVFEKLKVLRLSGNNLKKINKGILQLKNLEELYLNGNLMTNFPDLICEMHWLKKLDITGLTNINMYRGLELPVEALQKLKSLQAIGLANYSSAHGSMRFYSPYRNYPHLSWLETEEPLDLEPLALAEKAYALNGESVSFLLRYSEDSDLKKKVIADFYDPQTKTLDFKETYLEFLPAEIADFELEHLNLRGTRIGMVGSHFKTEEEQAKGYEQVDQERLAVIAKLKNLQSLNLYDCAISAFPKGMEQLQKLKKLDARFNYVKQVPESLGKLGNLETAEFRSTFSHYDGLPQIPDSFEGLKKLKKISFHFYEMDEELYQKRLSSLLPKNCEIDLS